jgi:protein ImuB
VLVDDRGLLSAPPAVLAVNGGGPLRVEAWAGPWPIDELWWDPAGARQVARFQMVAADGSAWLMVVESNQWWTEARYD